MTISKLHRHVAILSIDSALLFFNKKFQRSIQCCNGTLSVDSDTDETKHFKELYETLLNLFDVLLIL